MWMETGNISLKKRGREKGEYNMNIKNINKSLNSPDDTLIDQNIIRIFMRIALYPFFFFVKH